MEAGRISKKFLQTMLFGSCLKMSKTVHKNQNNLYQQFANLFVNVQEHMKKDDAVKRAQEEWWATKAKANMIKNLYGQLQTYIYLPKGRVKAFQNS